MPPARNAAHGSVGGRAARLLLCLAVALCVGGCATSYKVAPSNRKADQHAAKVSEHVSNAEVRAKSNKKRVQSAATKVVASEKAAGKVVDDINAALASLDLKDYPAAGHALIQAKIGAGILLGLYEGLKEDLRIVEKDNDDLIIDLALTKQQNEKVIAENAKFQLQVDNLARDQAKAQAIVDRVNWGFGLGGIIYGVQRLLTFAFFGVLILGAIVLALAVAAYFIGGPFARIVFGAFSRLLNRKKPG